MDLQQIEKEALKLSKKERASIVLTLIESINEAEIGVPEDEIEKLWHNEAEKRYNAYKQGKIQVHDLDTFIKEEQSRYK